MYCAKCGAQNPDDGKFCQNCGAGLTPAPAASQPQTVYVQPVTATSTSGMAVAALILGILGLFVSFLGVLAIIFGGVGIAQTNKNPNLKGKGMAVAGLVLGIIAVAIWIIIVVWASSFFWWLSSF
jgi:hypothetical protein